MPNVEIRGNNDLRKALRRFAPDLEKELRLELRAALMPVVIQARGFAPSTSPMSGWAARSFSEARFPFYEQSTITKGIGLSTGPSKPNKNGFSAMATIYNASQAGAIYETAGRKNPTGQPWVGPKAGGASKKYSRSSNPKAGQQFITNLPPLVFSREGVGRMLYRAWAANQGVALGAAMKAISNTKIKFYDRANTSALKKAA